MVTHQSLTYFERALRLPSSFPVSSLASLSVRKRVRSSSWRFFCQSHPLTPSPSSPREPLVLTPPFPPWSPPSFSVSLSLSLPCSRSDPPLLRSALARGHLSSLPPSDLTIWTDGSVIGKLGPGGSGVFINCSSCSSSFSLSFHAGEHCTSFVAEVVAIQHALSWSISHHSSCHFTSLLLLTDSLSALSVLSSAPTPLLTASLHSVWSSLASLCTSSISVSLQWIPGHSDIRGNDTADALAKSGTSLPSAAPQCLSPLKSYFRRSLYNSWRASVTSSLIPSQIPKVAVEELSLSRGVRCELSRLRCNGHSPLLNSYLHWIGRSTSPYCSVCGSENHDVPHVLCSCPSLSSTRAAIFGPSVSCFDLWDRPWGVARLLGLRGLPPRPYPRDGVG